MSSIRTRLLAAVALVLVSVTLVDGTSAEATPRWAPVSTATIRPGAQMYTGDAQCTGNFVFYDAAGNVYVGYAAHCAGTGSSTDTNGCKAASLPLGSAVRFAKGGNILSSGRTLGGGRLVYSSWLTMKRLKTTAAARCRWNDFALVRVNAADKGKVNPTVPYWGGPRTFGGAPLGAGAKLFSVGSSSLRGGALSKKTGNVISRDGSGLGYEIKGSGGIPGDSGSGFLDASGRAIGVLSTLSIGLTLFGTPVRNTIGDLYAELTFARQYSGIKGLMLAAGTVPFTGK
ncbi:hypothetical protein [Marmoricola sp. RAF53]|uniref:hypothetical protein n=1 Tax=Marmoricola sp. RAF53 TaxID=3233059 RepID=UPI003F989947